MELTSAWVFDHARSIPLQKNCHDCELFVCKFSELFLRESINYYFLSGDFEYFRKSIPFSLLIDELYLNLIDFVNIFLDFKLFSSENV